MEHPAELLRAGLLSPFDRPRRRRGRTGAASQGIMDIAAAAAHRALVRSDRPRLFAEDPQYRSLQLLLHAFLDAALSLLRCLLPAGGAPARPLALGRRGAAAAPSGAPRARGVSRRDLADHPVGSVLHSSGLGLAVGVGAPRHRPAAYELKIENEVDRKHAIRVASSR